MPRYIKYMTASGRIIGDYITDEFIPTQSAGMSLLRSDDTADPETQYVSTGKLAARTPRMISGTASAGGKAKIAGSTGILATSRGVDVDVGEIVWAESGDFVLPLAGAYRGELRVTVAPVLTPAEAQAMGILSIDDRARALSGAVMTSGHYKGQVYQDKADELARYRALTGPLLTLVAAQTQFPTLMAMVDVWNPEAVTLTAKLAALSAMAAKVETGIGKSRPYLRRLDAVAVRGKEQLKAAATADAKRAITAATLERMAAIAV